MQVGNSIKHLPDSHTKWMEDKVKLKVNAFSIQP